MEDMCGDCLGDVKVVAILDTGDEWGEGYILICQGCAEERGDYPMCMLSDVPSMALSYMAQECQRAIDAECDFEVLRDRMQLITVHAESIIGAAEVKVKGGRIID